MQRSMFVVSLLLLSCLSTQAKIVQYQDKNGRQYFTNTNPVTPTPQRNRPQTPVSVMTAPAQTLQLIQRLARLRLDLR